MIDNQVTRSSLRALRLRGVNRIEFSSQDAMNAMVDDLLKKRETRLIKEMAPFADGTRFFEGIVMTFARSGKK